MMKEKMSKFEDRSIEIIQSETKREKKFFKKEKVTGYIKNSQDSKLKIYNKITRF